MNSERLRGSEAKPRFDAVNPPLSEMAQRAMDAARGGDFDPLIDLASELVSHTSPGRMLAQRVWNGIRDYEDWSRDETTGTAAYDPHRQTYNGVPIRDLVDRGEWPLVKDGA